MLIYQHKLKYFVKQPWWGQTETWTSLSVPFFACQLSQDFTAAGISVTFYSFCFLRCFKINNFKDRKACVCVCVWIQLFSIWRSWHESAMIISQILSIICSQETPRQKITTWDIPSDVLTSLFPPFCVNVCPCTPLPHTRNSHLLLTNEQLLDKAEGLEKLSTIFLPLKLYLKTLKLHAHVELWGRVEKVWC